MACSQLASAKYGYLYAFSYWYKFQSSPAEVGRVETHSASVGTGYEFRLCACILLGHGGEFHLKIVTYYVHSIVRHNDYVAKLRYSW